MRRHPFRDVDRGALSVEYVIVVPAMLAMVALVYAYGQQADVVDNLRSAVRDAARAATLAPDYATANDRALTVVQEGEGKRCTSLTVTMSNNFEPGNPITVTARCTYALDLGFSLTSTVSFVSMLDPNRPVTTK